MNKITKTILIISITFFGVGFLSISSTQAVSPLEVEFESTPLFNQANFLPGDSVTRWVKVTNNSGETQRIATEAINQIDPDDLSSQLNLTIKEGTTAIFNDTLEKFFSQGETYLSDLADGNQTQYDFIITFNPGSENDYQEKTLGFDILVGFEGTEGGLPLPPSGGGTGGGGGGGIPPGLSIFNEAIPDVATTSVTIAWNTSYPSTSWVIYALEGEDYEFNLATTTYGYPHSYPNPEDYTKVTYHSVTIPGLAPGSTYYYRCVSHASLAISTEHSFTTLGTETEEETTEEETTEEEEGGEEVVEETEGEEGGEIIEGEAEEGTEGEETIEEEGEEEEEAAEIVEEEGDSNIFLAAVGGFFGQVNMWWILILVVVILVILLFLSKKRKRKKQIS